MDSTLWHRHDVTPAVAFSGPTVELPHTERDPEIRDVQWSVRPFCGRPTLHYWSPRMSCQWLAFRGDEYTITAERVALWHTLFAPPTVRVPATAGVAE